MFSKFLRRISVAVIGVIFLLGAFSGMSLCAKAQSPVPGNLKFFKSNRSEQRCHRFRFMCGA